MQRVAGAAVHRLGPAAAAASGSVHSNVVGHGRANVITSPGSPLARDDWVDVQALDSSEVSAAIEDLNRILHTRPDDGPVITEVDEYDSDTSDSSSANRFMASMDAGDGVAPMDNLTNMISNLMSNETVMTAVTQAMIQDPNFHQFTRTLGLPAPAIPLALEQGPPPSRGPQGPNLFEVLGEKMRDALDAIKHFIRMMFPEGVTSFRRALIENGRPTSTGTKVMGVALALTTIILTKRMVRIPMRM